jgi:hypothetical protein
VDQGLGRGALLVTPGTRGSWLRSRGAANRAARSRGTEKVFVMKEKSATTEKLFVIMVGQAKSQPEVPAIGT